MALAHAGIRYALSSRCTDPGSVAFAFFGGMLTAGLLGLCIPYLYRKRTGTYVPYSTGVSREPLASPGSAYSVPATTGAYGGGFGGGGYNSDKPTTAATSGGYGTL